MWECVSVSVSVSVSAVVRAVCGRGRGIARDQSFQVAFTSHFEWPFAREKLQKWTMRLLKDREFDARVGARVST